MPDEMGTLRDAVVDAALAWWRVPQVPRERWCSVTEQYEAVMVSLEESCAALDAAQMDERPGP